MSSPNYSTYESINEFIIEFLKNNSESKKLIQSWNEKSNQKEFKTLVVKFKNVKKSKDPNAPKASKSAYAFFCQDKRQEVKEKNLGIEASEMFTFFSQEWKALKEKKDKKSLSKIKAYEEMASKDKARYTMEMEDYEPSEGYEKKEKKVKVQKPRSAYLIYSAENREQIKKSLPEDQNSSTEIMKEIGRKWNELKEKVSSNNKKAIEEMKRYEEIAKEEKERLSPPKEEQKKEKKVKKPRGKGKKEKIIESENEGNEKSKAKGKGKPKEESFTDDEEDEDDEDYDAELEKEIEDLENEEMDGIEREELEELEKEKKEDLGKYKDYNRPQLKKK